MRLFLLGVLCWLASTLVAHAEGLQAQCGAMSGIGFYAEQGLATGSNAGWHEDAITDGETVVRVDLDTDTVDVRFKDATGVWQSVTDQGGRAMLYGAQSGTPSAFMVLVAYPGNVEVYTLAEVQGSSARLIHTQARSIATFTNGRLMTGECVLTRF
jgi:hypothetical protein